MRTKYLVRFLLLTAAFALTTGGILGWESIQFDLAGIWPFADELSWHPVHAIIIGLALLPPTIWEIFLLETHRSDKTEPR